MLAFAQRILQSARRYGNRSFSILGIHCATHQIRVILISGVVITSLFYPALALYFNSSHAASLSNLDAVQSAFFSKSRFRIHQDLDDLWTGYDNLRVCENAVCRARCGTGHVVRVERVLVQSALLQDEGALNRQILTSSLHLEQAIEDALTASQVPCLKASNGQCLILSPLAFWNHEEKLLIQDKDALGTLASSQNVTLSGLPITPRMVLAGRESNDPHVGGETFDFASYLALTFFFPESECDGKMGRAQWLRILRSAVGDGAELLIQRDEPSLIALQYASITPKWTVFSAFVYLAYTAFFAYVIWCVRSMDAVHSRIGLTFTALAEIASSTITSLSVCALVGFKVTMVPWELLPIVLMFVGAENMFNLVDAVSRTSITLPVKQRIAEGLSRAGTSNTLKVVSYNSILGVLSVFSTGAIRQFCVFAIVVLVAHWFLAHTFFITVLSIDIQRLELEELLRQGANLAPTIPNGKPTGGTHRSATVWQRVKGLLKGRATTNLSLLLLLTITGTLYYSTLPSTQNRLIDGNTELPRGALSRNSINTSGQLDRDGESPAVLIWRTLSPDETSTVHIRTEVPSIVTFRPDLKNGQGQSNKPHRQRVSMRTLRVILWLLKIMVLPITATTLLLWALTVYLLKNSELLEAQRNKPDANEMTQEEREESLEGKASFFTLVRGFEDDVEFLASSADGTVVISVGMRNDVAVWRSGKCTQIDASNPLHRAASSPTSSAVITALAVSHDGTYCAVGTSAGIIAVWTLNDSPRLLPMFSLERSTAGVTDLKFPPSILPRSSPPTSRIPSPSESVVLAAAFEHGIVIKWHVQEMGAYVVVDSCQQAPVVKASLIQGTGHSEIHNVLAAFALEDGSLCLRQIDDGMPLISEDFIVQAGNPADVPAQVHINQTVLDGEPRVIVAAASEAGVLTLWDGKTKELIHSFDDVFGAISRLRIAALRSETCSICGRLPPDGFSLTVSVGANVVSYVAIHKDETQRCSCSLSMPTHKTSWENLGRRSRSNSANTSPIFGRARLSEPSEFPVSGHGVHSRRASDHQTNRLSIPLPDDWDPSIVGPSRKVPTTSLPWSRVAVSKASESTCDRGAWDTVGGCVFGIRRLSRTSIGKQANGHVPFVDLSSTSGLSTNTLSRWELWSFDPSSRRLRTSPLSSLSSQEENTEEDKVPRLPFTRVSPFIITRSQGLAGFGNTLGVFRFLS